MLIKKIFSMPRFFYFLFFMELSFASKAQQHVLMQIETDKVKNKVSQNLHGVFFEEISHGGEGGLYAELIQNRGFEESRIPPGSVLEDGLLNPNPDKKPHYNLNGHFSNFRLPWTVKTVFPYWKIEADNKSAIQLSLDKKYPLTDASPQSAAISIKRLNPLKESYFINTGFWGINAQKNELYDLSFYTHSDGSYLGPLKVMLLSEDGSALDSHTFTSVNSSTWKKYTCTFIPKKSDGKARFAFSFGSTGNIWFDFVSLFPRKTFKNRQNGVRADLGQYLSDLKPAFVRWPGGFFVEGINIESAPNWKSSIGPVENRPGTFSVWGYWSSDGFGYHEYLQFCEDIGADALYVFNAGISCEFRSGTFISEENLQPVINDILDGIEYALGPVNSKWGKVRAANGHPKPFPLKYLEVGNEQHGPFYANRYNRFHDAIKRKYPGLKIISTMGIGDINKRTLDSIHITDMADEHAYKGAYWAFSNYDHFDSYKRGDYEVYVGEYATNSGVGNGNMLAALNDAAYIMGMENNGDLIKMSSYAPLFENVNTRHWPVNLIKFKSDSSFASISYYTLKLLNEQRADDNLFMHLKVLPLASPKPLNKGGIGLATWDTQTEYKDIEVLENGKIVYHSDFINHPEEWQTVRGNWKIQDDGIVQTVQGAQRLLLLKDKSFETYTLSLKAKKLSGTNAFIIPFAVNSSGTMLRAHIGALVNNSSVFESVMNESVINVSPMKKLPVPIEIGKWYNIRLEVGLDKVNCYLDGQLLISYSEPNKFIGLAGRDAITGDLIIKVVNVSEEAHETDIRLEGSLQLSNAGTAYVLSSSSLIVENSFEEPRKYIPIISPIKNIRNKNIQYTFPKYSVTVLRIKTQKSI